MHTKVTVITVCYNAESSIASTMDSVISQVYDNLEYIIVDGNSSDSTISIVSMRKSLVSKIVSEPDKGIFDAMNKGLAMATGEWVIFMNSGDSFVDSNVLANLELDTISQDIKMIYGDAIYLREKNKEYVKGKPSPYILRNMPNTHQAFLIRLSAAREFGFLSKYRYAADYSMVYNIYKTYGKSCVSYTPTLICNYEAVTGVSLVSKLSCQREVLQIRDCDFIWMFDYVKWVVKKILEKI